MIAPAAIAEQQVRVLRAGQNFRVNVGTAFAHDVSVWGSREDAETAARRIKIWLSNVILGDRRARV